MKLGITGRLFPLMFSIVVYGYTAKAVPELNIQEFKKKHKKEGSITKLVGFGIPDIAPPAHV